MYIQSFLSQKQISWKGKQKANVEVSSEGLPLVLS